MTRHIRRLAADRRGVVALLTGVSALPLALTVGLSIDFAQLVECKTTLQDAVDDAALAGATVYNTTAGSSEAVTVATNYIGTAPLPASMKLGTPSVTAASGYTNFNGSAYNVTVTASAKVAVSLLSTIYGSFTISATATASNPIVALKVNTGAFGSSASDWDSVYLYPVPMSNGKPAYGSFPSLSSFYEIGTNCNKADSSSYTSSSLCVGQSGATMPSNQTMPTITATQPIAFVLENMTGGVSAYGNNGYGAQQGHINLFLSANEEVNEPPSQFTNYSYNTTSTVQTRQGPQTVTSTVTTTYPTTSATLPNCSLLVQQVTTTSLPTAPPYKNACFSDTSSQSGYQYAAMSCASMNGNTYMYWWNDMGGGSDDHDYNDAHFSISCTVGQGSGTGNTEVVLTK